MKAPSLNKLHRYVGIAIAPFLVIQTLSGLLLDMGMFRRGASVPGVAAATDGWWDLLLAKAHFGPGLINDTYHILLACGIVWMAYSGWLLYLRNRRVHRQGGAPGERHGA